MKTADFDYHLPPERIAQHPADRRDASRMMVVHRDDGRIEHRSFHEIPDYLRRGDLLVLNNTRVVPARIYGTKARGGGKVELLFLEETEPGTWDCLMRCRRRPAPGGEVLLADGKVRAVMLVEGNLGRCSVKIYSDTPVLEILEQYGEPPLPPYIERTEHGGRTTEDRERYQTVFAREPGAVAAPTAGLHFTPEIFELLAAAGVERTEVTLHVGLGTFRPVTAEQVTDHVMEPERYEMPEATARKIVETKSRGGRVVVVGSTSVRTLETVFADLPIVGNLAGRSGLFIHPPYSFKVVDAMLTNFHLPKSTLLMMVCALAGRELIMKAYDEAIREQYRFYSYGDCMLIL